MEYFIKFSAILGLFYIVYKLFLEKETFFNTIRIHFILGIIAALTLPLIVIPEYVYIESILVNEISPAAELAAPVDPAGLDFVTILGALYMVGFLFFMIRFFIQLGSLAKFIFKFPKTRQNGYVLIEADETTSPFSFFNYIIYPKNGFSHEELEQIIAHEKVHASQYHSLDILLTQLVIIFNWCNPLAWMYLKEVQKNLEFIADQGAQKSQLTAESYQYLLLKTVTPNYSLALTSKFYNSIIKKRINMLHKDKSGKMMYFKFIFIIPVLIAFVFTFNTKVIAQEKKHDKVEIHKNVEIEVITKDFQKEDLEKLKASLLKKGITLNFKKVKYNDKDEIIGIQISVANKQNNKSQIEQMGSSPINPISIKFDDKGALAVGNFEEIGTHSMFFSTSGDKVHKKVIVTSDGDISKKDMSSYVFVSDDGSSTHVKVVNGKKVIEEIHGPGAENVWISESGDTTKVKRIEIIEIDEESDGEKQVIIKKIKKDGEDIEVIMNTSDDLHKGHNQMVFISDDGEQPLMIIDGVEKPNMKMDDINTDDIKKIEVLKGGKAVEKYGEKAKDGVVLITTKK